MISSLLTQTRCKDYLFVEIYNMVHKFLSINNVGALKKVSFGTPNWNGIFEKYNAIYADNGSGKTTFTQVLKSIQNATSANQLLKKKSFDSTEDVSVSYINDQKQQCNFSNGKWNIYDSLIDVFDSYYVEDNVYIISLGPHDGPGSCYEILVGEKAIQTYNEILSLIERRKKERVRRRNLRKLLKEDIDQTEVQSIKDKIKASSNTTAKINKKLTNLEARQSSEAEEFAKSYLGKINGYLARMGTEMQLTGLKKVATKLIYHISISNHVIRSNEKNLSLSHTLSEGEKNCLAFAFFLARLELRLDLANRTVIFDDPIGSLDANRRSMTLNILTSIARRCKQFVLLSHDMQFVKDFKRKISETQVLKICRSSESSQIIPFDVERETLNGIFKDLLILREYAKDGEMSGHNPRDVVRCIRPIIEGFFRIKYYLHINDGEWLGDFIAHVRDANPGEPFAAQKTVLTELVDINDYSKTYHHSNPNWMEEPLSPTELQVYCKLVFSVIEKI